MIKTDQFQRPILNGLDFRYVEVKVSIRHWARRGVVSTRYAESPLIPDTEQLAATAMAAVTSFIQSSKANISPAFPSFLIPSCTAATSSHVHIYVCLSLSVLDLKSELESI